MSGEKNLTTLIQEMKPQLNGGEYVFATLLNVDNIPREDTLCEFKEKEGTTIVIEKQKADRLQLEYTYICSWITLLIHSSLEAVGLTAIFATALAKHNISCNVIAGYYHDHIFVDHKDADRAIEALTALSKSYPKL